MESSDDEIIENNSYEDEYDTKPPEKKSSKEKDPKIKSNLNLQNNNTNNQIKSSNTISSLQQPQKKQIISVSVILPKKTTNTKRNINKNNIIKRKELLNLKQEFQVIKNFIEKPKNNEVKPIWTKKFSFKWENEKRKKIKKYI